MKDVKEMGNIELYRRLKMVNGVLNRLFYEIEDEDVYHRQINEYMVERDGLNTEIERRGFTPLY